MMSDLARNTYQQIEVNSSNGLELVVMLYDGAIRFLGDARTCLRAGNLAGKAHAVDRALAIIGELQSTLRFEDCGELPVQLDQLYTYMNNRILEASLKRNAEPLDEVIKLLSILNSGWKEIARRSEQPAVVQGPPYPSAPSTTEASYGDHRSAPLEIFG